MNISILIHSFKYLDSYYFVSQLATWLSTIKYTDDKLINSFDKNDLDVSESIIHLNEDKQVLNDLLLTQLVKCINYHEFIKTIDIYRRTELLLRFGASAQIDDNILLRTACMLGSADVVQLLLRFGAEPTDRCYNAFEKAYRNDHLDIVETMLNHIINNKDVFYCAVCYGGTIEMIKKIMTIHNYMIRKDNIIISAVLRKDIDIIKLLVENDANIHAQNDRPLRDAVQGRCYDIVEYFLSIDIGVDAVHKALSDIDNYQYYNFYSDIIKLLIGYITTKQK